MIWYDMLWYDMIWYGMAWYVMVWTLNSPFLILWCSFHPTGNLLMDFSCNNSFNPKALFIIFQKLWITVSIQMLFQLCIRNCESWVYSLIAGLFFFKINNTFWSENWKAQFSFYLLSSIYRTSPLFWHNYIICFKIPPYLLC